MKKIILTGGGTAGHVTPHLALLPYLKDKFEIHYIGSATGIEKEIITKHKYIRYHEISCAKLVRSLTVKNLTLPFKLIKGVIESKRLIKELQPSVIFSKGGFVAVPVVYAAGLSKVPVISHESDLTLGLANKLILRKCEVMCCSFEKTVKECKNKGLFTGSPMRKELFLGNKEIAQNNCKFKNLNKPCVLFMGGSLGATAINKTVLQALDELVKNYNIIHIVGKGNLSGTKKEGYFEIEFVNDIEHYFALCDIVVSRAGSNSINEFLSLKKPMLLIPLPKEQSRGDQILNAYEFQNDKLALVLEQNNLNKHTLIENIHKLIKNKNTFVSAMKNKTEKNAVQEIYNLIVKHAK